MSNEDYSQKIKAIEGGSLKQLDGTFALPESGEYVEVNLAESGLSKAEIVFLKPVTAKIVEAASESERNNLLSSVNTHVDGNPFDKGFYISYDAKPGKTLYIKSGETTVSGAILIRKRYWKA